MNQASPIFRKPNLFERTLNKTVGVLVGLGIGLRHNYLVEVPGRRTGRLYKELSGNSERVFDRQPDRSKFEVDRLLGHPRVAEDWRMITSWIV